MRTWDSLLFVLTYFDESDIIPITLSSIAYIITCTVLFECTPKIDAVGYALYFVTAPILAYPFFGAYLMHFKTMYSVTYIFVGFLILGIANVPLRRKRKKEEQYEREKSARMRNEEEQRKQELIEIQKNKLMQDRNFQELRAKALANRLDALHDITALLTECLYDIPTDLTSDGFLVQPTEEDMQRIALEKARQLQLNHARGLFVQLYDNKSIESIIDAPNGVTIGNDGLPREDSAREDWGKTYTFYRTPYGKAYHRLGCSCHPTIKIHAYHAQKELDMCQTCWPTLPDMKWYDEYLAIKQVERQFKNFS